MEEQINKKVINLPENSQVDPVFELMLKKHLSLIKKEGIIDEIRRRRYYEKPSTTKRLKQKGKFKNVNR